MVAGRLAFLGTCLRADHLPQTAEEDRREPAVVDFAEAVDKAADGGSSAQPRRRGAPARGVLGLVQRQESIMRQLGEVW